MLYLSVISTENCFPTIIHNLYKQKSNPIRCKIPECDLSASELTATRDHYRPEWLTQAVPFEANGKPSQCRRYMATPRPSPSSDGIIGGGGNDTSSGLTCQAWTFDRTRPITCDTYVYATEEVTLVNEVNTTTDTETR